MNRGATAFKIPITFGGRTYAPVALFTPPFAPSFLGGWGGVGWHGSEVGWAIENVISPPLCVAHVTAQPPPAPGIMEIPCSLLRRLIYTLACDSMV